MAGADFEPKPESKKKGFGLHRPKRVGIKIDMTPMVDIAFLLLIFFMVSTVFRQPQAMEITLPPKDAKVEVAQSNVMTLFVDKDGRIFYRMSDEPLTGVTMKELNRLFVDAVKLNPDLVLLVKVSRKSRYENMVDMMDELEFANMSKFSVVPMTPEDDTLVAAQP